MSADPENKPGPDEQHGSYHSPVEREVSEGEDGGEIARDATEAAGISFGLIIVVIFVLFVVVLLGYIVANAL